MSEDHEEGDKAIKFLDWGFKLDRLFEVAYRFYKRNESKAFHPSFDTRNQMNALMLQARYGDSDDGKAPDIGVLDFVGKRRQHEWTLLKGMSRTEAMSKFICNLDDLCPLFKVHAEAVKVSSGLERSIGGDQKTNNILDRNGQSSSQSIEDKEQLKTIYSSLCRQTHDQFKSYAEQQWPQDIVKQKQLIQSLQEQYFQQYVTQMHPGLRQSFTLTQKESEHSDIKVINPDSTVEPTNIKINGEHASGDDRVAPKSDREPAANIKMPLPAQPISHLVHPKTVAVRSRNDHEVIEIPNSIEADISSEELNTSDYMPMYVDPSRPDGESLPAAIMAPSMPDSPTLSNTPSEAHKASPKTQRSAETLQPQVEHVRLYRNNEAPPIALFESFPEPKLVKVNVNPNRIAVDSLNPNLVRQPDFKDQADEASDHDRPAKGDNVDSAEPAEQDPPQPSGDKPQVFNDTSSPLPAMSHSCEDHNLFENPQLPSLPPLNNLPTSNGKIDVPKRSPNTGAEPQNVHQQHDETSCTKTSKEVPACRNHVCEPELWGSQSSDSEGESMVDNGHEEDMLTNQATICEPASTWSKKGVAEFIDSLGGDKQGGVYEVKEGTVVVIQVPTYPDGRYIYWEFATEDYDIGFGLEFVYRTRISEPLALNIYEESDDDEEAEFASSEDPGWSQTRSTTASDPEAANLEADNYVTPKALVAKHRNELSTNTITIVPTYRRDSHEEIFVGRHKYPGLGYYLLRFDNTYSVLRSKTLYFRICYFV